MAAADGHWLDTERLRVYPRIFVAIYAAAVLGYLFTSRDGIDAFGKPLGSDFMAFYAAGRLALDGRAVDAFDLQAFVSVQEELFPAAAGIAYGWFYPPTFLLLVAPLALLPYVVAYATFIAGSVAAWWTTLRRAIGRPGGAWLAVAFPGLWVCLAQGQNGLLTAALAGGSLLFLHGTGSEVSTDAARAEPAPTEAAFRRTANQGIWAKPNPWLAGVLLGLLAIKPHLAVLFAVALVAARAWTTLASAAVTAAAFVGLSVAVLGMPVLTAWVDGLEIARIATEQGLLPWAKMPSVFAMLRLFGAPVAWSYAAHAVIAVAAVVATWLVWRRSTSVQLRGAVLMAGTFLVNPYAFDYDLVWLAFPIAWLALHGLANGWRRGDREVLVAAWMLPAVASAFAVLTHVQLGPVVLALLVWIALRRVLRPDPAAD